MNSRSAPGRILVYHPLVECSKLGIDLGSAATLCLRSKGPEQTKASPVSADNGFRFDDNRNVSPRRPKAAEQDPKYAILDSQPRARLFSLEYFQLLTEGEDLRAEVVAGTEKCAEAGVRANEKWNHRPGFIA